jgi:hypothetical protein
VIVVADDDAIRAAIAAVAQAYFGTPTDFLAAWEEHVVGVDPEEARDWVERHGGYWEWVDEPQPPTTGPIGPTRGRQVRYVVPVNALRLA